MEKIEEIEILRAVAILLTLTQHLGHLFCPTKAVWAAVNKNQPFWGGVDLFFCISGFVICKSLVKSWPPASWRHHWADTWKFWVRRVFRIVPTLWVWIMLFLLGTLFFNDAGGFGALTPNLNDARAAVLNYSNAHIFLCVIGKSSCGPNPVYWSLSLEEQFYLLLPLLLLLPVRFIQVLVVGLILAQLPIHRMPWDQSLGGALWFFRTDAMLLGVVLAYLSTTSFYAEANRRIERLRPYRGPISILLIFALFGFPRSGFSAQAGGIAIVSSCLVFLASFDRGFLFGQSRWLKPIVWIGSRSFSIYLMHIPLYYFVNELAFRISGHSAAYRAPLSDNPFHPVTALLTFAVIFAAAECNYRLIETPLRKLGRKLTERDKPTGFGNATAT